METASKFRRDQESKEADYQICVSSLAYTNEELKLGEREAREMETLLPITMAHLPQQEDKDKENNHHHPLQQ